MGHPGVYILQSKRNKRYYIGSTNNLKRRFIDHEKGKVIATKFIRPLEFKVFIECVTTEEAKKSEYRLKRYKSRKIIEKVIESGVLPWNYS